MTAPSGADTTIGINEDQSYALAEADFGFSDTDGDLLAEVTITGVAGGTLYIDTGNDGIDPGDAVTAPVTVTVAQINAGQVYFVPDADLNGAAAASLTFQVTDDALETDPTDNAITFDIAAVNDEPAGTDNTVSGSEDVPYVFTVADFPFTDVDGNALLAVQITTLPAAGQLLLNGAAVNAGDFVSAADIQAGLLTFVGAQDASGAPYATFTFQVQDDGGTANGGVDLDGSANTMAVELAAVNDPPAGADNTVTAVEDTPYVFSDADFPFTDVEGNALLAVRIATLPAVGQLLLNGVAVNAGDFVSLADIQAGLLTFVPTADANGAGYASFQFDVQDDGGTANGGVDVDTASNTLTIDVTSVNDEPAGTDNTVTGDEDTAYVFAAGDFPFTDVEGNGLLAVRIASLPAVGQLLLGGVAVVAGAFVSLADIQAGLLTFVPAAGESGAGYASFTFQVQDDGGTANGGVDLDASANLLTIDITAVNDVPVANADTASGPDNATTVIDALANDTDDDGDPLTIVAASVQGGLGSVSIVNNELVFDPGVDFDELFAGESAVVTIDYTIEDPSGASASSTVTFTVNGTDGNPVNGGSGNNALSGTALQDFIQGFTGDDVLSGLGGSDRLEGGLGNDTLNGGDGNDRLNGGIGRDTVNGDAGDDTLEGGIDNDVLNGGAGNDVLSGGNNDDRLNGGTGNDVLTGGSGRDTFVFTETGGADEILDFSRTQFDKIDLTAIDARTTQIGNQAFTFIGTANFSGAGQLRVFTSGGDTFVAGDVNGDLVADFTINLNGANVVAGDFFL